MIRKLETTTGLSQGESKRVIFIGWRGWILTKFAHKVAMNDWNLNEFVIPLFTRIVMGEFIMQNWHTYTELTAEFLASVDAQNLEEETNQSSLVTFQLYNQRV